MSFKVSILNSYQHRHILLTGATGFLGKVLLAMMLEKVPVTGCIYVLIRNDNTHSALERFIHKITTSPAFDSLRQQQMTAFSEFIAQHVKVIEGDITLPNLGMTDRLKKHLQSTLDLVINSAGLVNFFPDLHRSLEINVVGALHLAEFVRHCQKAAFLHISTCYVAGGRDGVFQETVNFDEAPNGQRFDVEAELSLITTEIQQIQQSNPLKKRARFKLIEFGQARAQYWGWTNTYCYTKALAEYLLNTRYPDIQMAIARPSIIESAWHFPFSGWNEGLNTCAPMTYVSGKWYPFVIAKKNNFLDVVPIDFVTNAIILIGAQLLTRQAKTVYQLSSSDQHPLTLKIVSKQSRLWHRHDLKKNGTTWAERHLRARLPLICISLSHPFSPHRLTQWVDRLSHLFKLVFKNTFITANINKKLTRIKNELNRLEKIFKVFSPFTHDYQCVFISRHLNEIQPIENQFNYDLKTLDWYYYWHHIHMTGMNRWIFPLYQNKNIIFDTKQLTFTEELRISLMSFPITD